LSFISFIRPPALTGTTNFSNDKCDPTIDDLYHYNVKRQIDLSGTRSAARLSLEPKIRRTDVNSFFTGLSAINLVGDALAGGRRRKLLRFI
jgi:hypothetical protein